MSVAAPSALLSELAQRLGDVSPAWRDAVRVEPGAPEFTAGHRLHPRMARGIETIREGWLLHRGRSRVAAAASPNLALLIGDWCYAAGLRDVTEHGTLDDVRALADLIATVSTRASDPAPELEAVWQEMLDQLRQ